MNLAEVYINLVEIYKKQLTLTIRSCSIFSTLKAQNDPH